MTSINSELIIDPKIFRENISLLKNNLIDEQPNKKKIIKFKKKNFYKKKFYRKKAK